MNRAYIGKLMELAEKDPDIIHIIADSGTAYDEMFRKYFPKQIYNFGIGEENMVAAASGMASVGKKPFIFTAGAFLAYRAMEYIRDDVCFQNLNVKIVGMGSGLSWSSLGPTHHTTEDISVLRAIPNLMILSPSTPRQVAACVQTAYEHNGPVYIKIGMNNESEFFGDNYVHSVDKTDCMREGKDLAIFVTGSILGEAMRVCDMLEQDHISVKLINVTTIKPFNVKNVEDIVKEIENLAVIEEHNIYGGLASIISETITYNGLKARVIPIGLNDIFAEGYGTYEIVRKVNRLNAEGIYIRLKEALGG